MSLPPKKTNLAARYKVQWMADCITLTIIPDHGTVIVTTLSFKEAEQLSHDLHEALSPAEQQSEDEQIQ